MQNYLFVDESKSFYLVKSLMEQKLTIDTYVDNKSLDSFLMNYSLDNFIIEVFFTKYLEIIEEINVTTDLIYINYNDNDQIISLDTYGIYLTNQLGEVYSVMCCSVNENNLNYNYSKDIYSDPIVTGDLTNSVLEQDKIEMFKFLENYYFKLMNKLKNPKL